MERYELVFSDREDRETIISSHNTWDEAQDFNSEGAFFVRPVTEHKNKLGIKDN